MNGQSQPVKTVSAPEQTDEAEDKTIVVTAAFARHVLTRLPLSRAMKKVLRALLDAHPDWLPPPALHRAAGYSKPAQFRGLMGAFGKRMANTEGYDPEAHFFEYRWNEDENVLGVSPSRYGARGADSRSTRLTRRYRMPFCKHSETTQPPHHPPIGRQRPSQTANAHRSERGHFP